MVARCDVAHLRTDGLHYASGLVPLQAMVRAGLLLDVLMVPIMLALMMSLGRAVFGIEPGVLPGWAR